jgi:hypothetical protein
VTRTPGAGPSWETGLQVDTNIAETLPLTYSIINTGSKKRRTSCSRLNGILLSAHLEYHSVCLLFRMGTPLSRKRVRAPPEPKEGTHSPVGEGSHSDDWRKSLAFSLLCGTVPCSIAQGAELKKLCSARKKEFFQMCLVLLKNV